jgi:hypothetical protein
LATGIEGVEEEAGQFDPGSQMDATNLARSRRSQVTPIQARLVAALRTAGLSTNPR